MTKTNETKVNWKWAVVLFAMMIGWALIEVGIRSAKADLMMDSMVNPAYAALPQNMYHNVIYDNKSSNNSFDKCKTPGSVRKIVVEKSKKKMTLFDVNDCVVKEYNVVTGKNKGPKQCDGDKKTPEGTYTIVEKRDSKYHKFLALDYPQAKDLKRAKELGCYAGDSIGIHSWIKGLPIDGSLGCIRVMTKEEILEINDLVSVGTKVEIVQ